MELLKGKENIEKAKSLEVAEEAREESWKYPSFVGELFTGKVRWDLIFPYPIQEESDKKVGDEFLKKLEAFFDLVFIDAHKPDYINYWEECLPKVRKSGLIVVDNVLWSGRVLNPKDESDFAIDKFNKHIINDSRVEVVMLTVRDGITLAMKL